MLAKERRKKWRRARTAGLPEILGIGWAVRDGGREGKGEEREKKKSERRERTIAQLMNHGLIIMTRETQARQNRAAIFGDHMKAKGRWGGERMRRR